MDDMEQMEKTYWTKEISTILGIGTSTLRKWCILLEKRGYQFARDDYDRRAYTKADLVILERLRSLIKENQMPLNMAADFILSSPTVEDRDSLTVQEITLDKRSLTRSNDERYASLMSKINELVLHKNQQNVFNQALFERLENQEELLENAIRTRDEVLTKTLRELAAARESKKWWRFLIKK